MAKQLTVCSTEEAEMEDPKGHLPTLSQSASSVCSKGPCNQGQYPRSILGLIYTHGDMHTYTGTPHTFMQEKNQLTKSLKPTHFACLKVLLCDNSLLCGVLSVVLLAAFPLLIACLFVCLFRCLGVLLVCMSVHHICAVPQGLDEAPGILELEL